MNANLIFKWLKDPRFQPEETVFLPVEVSSTNMAPTPSLPDLRSAQQSSGRIEIALVNGHRLTIEGGFDGDALARLLKELMP